jgi:hypothetical protein
MKQVKSRKVRYEINPISCFVNAKYISVTRVEF